MRRLRGGIDIADRLRRYIEAKERAAELDGKIKRTDDLINEIVYELYGLTDEEIEIVESAVGKLSINPLVFPPEILKFVFERLRF